MSKIAIQPTERGLMMWFSSLSYRHKLDIFNYFKDIDLNDD